MGFAIGVGFKSVMLGRNVGVRGKVTKNGCIVRCRPSKMVSMAKRDYQHSRILDVHRWSDHPETNSFVNHVYERYLGPVPGESRKIQKKHLKVVLLDLYVAWQTDRLNQLMREAFAEITQSRRIKVKYNRNLTKRQLYIHGAQDRNWFLDMIASMRSPYKSDGYKLRLRKHKAWLDASED